MLIKPRKCRATDQGEEGPRRKVRTMWDVDSSRTSALLEDMGVSILPGGNTEQQTMFVDNDEEDQEMSSPRDHHPTPEILVVQNCQPPPAPKVSHLVSCGNNNNLVEYEYMGGVSDVSPVYTIMDIVQPILTSPSDVIIHKRHHELTPGLNNEWNRLSDEIILAVFKWLPKSTLVKCARVCRRWSRLAFDETLWRRLDLANKTLKPGVIGRILDRGVAVLRLAKSEVRTPLYKDLGLTASPRVSRVQYLDMSMSSCSTEALEQLIGTCHYLRKLSLENCQINDNICRYIGQNTNLEVLNLCMCRGLTENGLVPICNNLQKLESLNVAWTDMSRGAVVYLVICLPSSLLKLNLSGCRQNLLDEDVQQLCRSCSHLKELDLSDATVLTCLAIEYIAAMLRGLEYIALSRCYHVAPASLPILGQILTLLALDVFGMLKEMALQQLKQTMPNIEINKFPFSSIARPTTGIRRTSIWGLRVRDNAV